MRLGRVGNTWTLNEIGRRECRVSCVSKTISLIVNSVNDENRNSYIEGVSQV